MYENALTDAWLPLWIVMNDIYTLCALVGLQQHRILRFCVPILTKISRMTPLDQPGIASKEAREIPLTLKYANARP